MQVIPSIALWKDLNLGVHVDIPQGHWNGNIQ